MTTLTVFRQGPPPLILCGMVPDRGYEKFELTLGWLEASGFLVERFDPTAAASPPRALKAVLPALAPSVRQDALVVSLAPTLARLP